MSWDIVRAFTSTKVERGPLPADMQAALDKSLTELLAPNEFVLYERHDPAMIARMVRKEGVRYVVTDVRTDEEMWVGAESLLQYGKPLDEWFRDGFLKDHKDLFLPIYLSPTFDELVDAWQKVDAKLERKGERWRLVNELRRAWVPRWGTWSEREVRGGVVGGLSGHHVVSWDKTSSPPRVLVVEKDSLVPAVGLIRTP
jgi:hypothetical protein